ncbi:hypothetical protein CDD83_5148 [Cordyceps sp. RAO-2017]|nr:hypothetical protein CDD83_5148 [Cordyceps sp. RAO-2017]
MTDPHMSSDSPNPPASSWRLSDSTGIVSSSVRSRNRRHDYPANTSTNSESGDQSAENAGLFSTDLLSSPPALGDTSPSMSVDPGAGSLTQFLGESWAQGWNLVQGYATTIFSNATEDILEARTPRQSRSRPRNGSGPGVRNRSLLPCGSNNQATWGPVPPSPNLGRADAAAWSSAEREMALIAARTASVLESHDGVNGGLDVTGTHKRRNSDEDTTGSPFPEDCLVYIHHVQPHDTFAGLIVRYQCRADVFGRANGLWSRDSIQTRKWLAIPVDACEIRGRPCEAPPPMGRREDTHAVSSSAVEDKSTSMPSFPHNVSGKPRQNESSPKKQEFEGVEPWIHVRWIKFDPFSDPVQIGRVPRQTLGYFPPRRKKSINAASSASTPRGSLDLTAKSRTTAAQSFSPEGSNYQQTIVPSQSSFSQTPGEASDQRPAWMRRSGGVGSIRGTTRSPGPAADYLNSWTRRHIPGLNLEELPSISMMGSETARFGFAPESSNIIENHVDYGRDTLSVSRQSSGLDKAAAAVETWLRGALARRPSTPVLGSRTRSLGGSSSEHNSSDLIELADTRSDNGRVIPE